MAFNINTFRSELKGDGARPTLFEVQIYFPVSLAGVFPTAQTAVQAKASSLPGSTLGIIEVPYFGRKIKVAGDRTFDDWTMTLINDEDFNIRNAFEFWHNAMDQYTTGSERKRVNGANENPYSYVSNVYVKQFGKQGNVIKVYELVNAFPNQISQIDVSWENNDQIEEFDVTWSYDYFKVLEAGELGSVSDASSFSI
jgi:hypothetical protein